MELKSLKYSSFSKAGLILCVSILAQACTLNVPIADPNQSDHKYAPTGEGHPVNLALKTELGADHKISHGRLSINLTHAGAPLQAEQFVADNLTEELQSRGLPITLDDSSDNTLVIKDFQILNHRVSGFSPLVTIATLKADLDTEKGHKRIASMIKRGKVPVWTMDEINDPCYNEPVELMIKEVAAKINQSLFNYSLSDDEVEALVTKVRNEGNKSRLAYFDVYELGFSNNPKAVEPLLEFSSHKSDYVRMAAISSLGILGAQETLPNLESIYQNGQLWQDRGMALKAIGDIGNKEAMDFLRKEQERWINGSSSEAKWNSSIISLYLD